MGSHLIHTQLLEANFQSKESALSGQKLLQERYREVLLPMMEQIFDAYEPIGRSLRIDKIELDLGRFPADLPENMIRDRLRHVLEDQFRKSIWNKEFSLILLIITTKVQTIFPNLNIILIGKKSYVI